MNKEDEQKQRFALKHCCGDEGKTACLTNGDKMNGAGLILQGDLMQQIEEIVGGDFYILPSSCHEVLVIPEAMGMDVKELSAMVQQVNETEVSTEDRLSDHVQHYDSKEEYS